MVVVTEQFLGVDRQSAAQVVANLMAERMKQFERLVADGLPALSEQQGLRAAYLGFQTTPAGLGTAATRIPATT